MSPDRAQHPMVTRETFKSVRGRVVYCMNSLAVRVKSHADRTT